MPARVFVHPACTQPSTPAYACMVAALQRVSLDTSKICIGPQDPRGHRELLWIRQHVGSCWVFERFSGEMYTYRLPTTLDAA